MRTSAYQKLIDAVTSTKLWTLLIATWLFYIDTLNQDGWITVVLMTTGMRAVNEVATVYKEIRTGAQPLPTPKGKK